MDQPGQPEAAWETGELLGGEELRHRAAGGAVVLGARGALILALGLPANILLARLLVPRDFGIVALGSALLVFGGYLADGGLGMALIGRAEPPTRRELEAVNGAQLTVTGALALVCIAGSIPFGRDGLVVAAMVASLPLAVLRTPAVIALERKLEYRVIATADVIEALSFYASALTMVALGLGVWGMAGAMTVRAIAGTAVMTKLGPLGLVRPRWSWSDIRPLARFGLKVQAVTVIEMVRDQGLNVAVAAIGGLATLGVWNLTWRVLQVPFTLLATVVRIGYPAMSRLLAAGEDPRPAIERGLAAVAVATGLLLVALVGSVRALPTLVGGAWADVPETLLWASLALIIGAPVFVVLVGYLYAADAAGTVVRCVLLQAAVWLAVAVPLVSTIGAPAIGLGWVAGSALSAIVLARQTVKRTGAAVARSLAVPTAIATVAGASGWLVSSAGGEKVLHGVVGSIVGELVLVGGLALVRRSVLHDTYRLLTGSVRASVKPRNGVPA